MPYKIEKKPCTQADGDKGTHALSYTDDTDSELVGDGGSAIAA